jgi:hypothetical protein
MSTSVQKPCLSIMFRSSSNVILMMFDIANEHQNMTILLWRLVMFWMNGYGKILSVHLLLVAQSGQCVLGLKFNP